MAIRLAPPAGHHTIARVARALKLSRQRVYALIHARKLRPVRARDAAGRTLWLLTDAHLDALRSREPGRPWPERPHKQRLK